LIVREANGIAFHFRDEGKMTDTGLLRLRWRAAARGYEISNWVLAWGNDRARTINHPGGSAYVLPKGYREAHVVLRAKTPWRTYEARLLEKNIFLELARTPPTPEGVISFVDEWGFPSAGHPQGCSLAMAYKAINFMTRLIEAGSKRTGGDSAAVKFLDESFPDLVESRLLPHGPSALGSFDTFVEWETRGSRGRDKPRMYLEAHSLFQFCILEFLQALAGGIDIKTCGHCGEYLRIPTSGRPPQYCDDACRQAACRARRKRSLTVRTRAHLLPSSSRK
jgi:hypothetical protein